MVRSRKFRMTALALVAILALVFTGVALAAQRRHRSL